ncbi:MAG TPA: energy transducer TonB [Flavobacteriales bacterium]
MYIRIHCAAFAFLSATLVSAQVDKEHDDIAPVQVTDEPGPPAREPDSTTVYTVVEQMPEFPGGSGALMVYLSKNIQYPAEALEAGIEGKVFLRFVVDREGLVKDVEVLRGVPGAPSLQQEAVRVVKRMPRWAPGRQNGKAVATHYTLPVMFKMTGQEQKEK